MRTHALPFPLIADDPDWTGDSSTSQAIAAILPGVKAGIDTAPGDFLLLEEASSMTASSLTAATPFARTERLVVLVPENELDENEVARRIWRLAAPGGLEVLLLSLSPEPGSEAYLHMRLASLASQIRDERVKAGIAFAPVKNWIEAAERTWRPGDLLVCLKGQRASSRITPALEPGTQLSETLKAPVYFMNGLELGPSLRQLQMRKEWIAWAGFLGTLAAFGWVQLQINRATTDNVWTLLMALSVLVEVAVLWKINESTY